MLDFIYSIKDKRTGEVGYIGVTNNPNLRMSHHIQGNDGNDKKDAWFQTIDPDMDILEVIKDNRARAYKRERYWIQHYLRRGANLVNIRCIRPLPDGNTCLLSFDEYVELPWSDPEKVLVSRFAAYLSEQWKGLRMNYVTPAQYEKCHTDFEDMFEQYRYEGPSQQHVVNLRRKRKSDAWAFIDAAYEKCV